MNRDNVIDKVIKEVARLNNIEEHQVYEIINYYISDVYKKLSLVKLLIKVENVMIPFFGKFVLIEKRFNIKTINANCALNINNFKVIHFNK